MNHVHSVMIVDDNEADLEIATYYLERSKRYSHILSASDGQEALEIFKEFSQSQERFDGQFPPTLILLDINMPRLNGFEFLEGYSELELEIPDPVFVVMLTSSLLDSDIEKAESSKLVHEYITKPFTEEQAIELADRFGKKIEE